MCSGFGYYLIAKSDKNRMRERRIVVDQLHYNKYKNCVGRGKVRSVRTAPTKTKSFCHLLSPIDAQGRSGARIDVYAATIRFGLRI